MKVQIGEAFYFIQNGANIKQGVVDGGIPITRIETISNNQFNRDRMGYAGITDVQKYSPYILQDGDILMSHINSLAYLGRAVLYNKQNNETIIHGMNLLRLKANREIILPAYACYFFQTNAFKEQINRIAKKSVNQASFSVADLKRTVMSVVPLEEQNKIVSRLDKINSLISLRKKQLQKLDDLVKSRFVEMFAKHNERIVPLKTICIKGPQNGFYRKGAEINGTIPIMKMKQLFGNESMSEAHDCDLVALTKTELERFLLTQNDLLFGRRSLVVEGAGKCRRVGRITTQAVFESSMLRVTLDATKVKPRYLQIWFNSEEGKNAISSIRAVTTIAGIKGSDLANVEVPVAPIALQEEFLEFVGQCDRSKLTIQKSLDKLELLKQSLMQKYFG